MPTDTSGIVDGKMRVSRVTLRPSITLAAGADEDRPRALIDKAPRTVLHLELGDDAHRDSSRAFCAPAEAGNRPRAGAAALFLPSFRVN